VAAEAEVDKIVKSAGANAPRFFDPGSGARSKRCESHSKVSAAIAKTLAEGSVRQLQHTGLEDSYERLTRTGTRDSPALAECESIKEVATVVDISPYIVETHRAISSRRSPFTMRPRSCCTPRKKGLARVTNWKSALRGVQSEGG
jgi:hypothetical protein